MCCFCKGTCIEGLEASREGSQCQSLQGQVLAPLSCSQEDWYRRAVFLGRLLLSPGTLSLPFSTFAKMHLLKKRGEEE